MLTVLLAKAIGVVVALFFLGILVFVHELGHFLFARLTGMSVSTFSIGFGRVLLRRTWRGVEYRLSLIPCGGYVDILGMSNDRKANQRQLRKLAEQGRQQEVLDQLADESRWFCNKSPLARILVSAGGPLFSILLAVPMIVGVTYAQGKAVTHDEPPMVASVQAESVLRPGDRILSANGEKTDDIVALHLALIHTDKKEVPLTVERAGRKMDLAVTPDRSGKVPMLGVGYASHTVEVAGPLDAVTVGLSRTWQYTRWQIATLGDFLSGKLPMRALSGPVGIVRSGVDASKNGAGNLIIFFALITIGLGFTNLLPIPCLDGGHILFACIEGIFGSMHAGAKTIMHYCGAALLVSFVVFVTLNDLGVLTRILAVVGL